MSSQQTKKKAEVRIRQTQRGSAGYQSIFVSAAGLTDVKIGVMSALEQSWGGQGLKLVPENILLFLVCPDNTLKKVETDQDIVLEKGTKYVALEYFTVVPVDLFRTVANRNLQNVTLAHPIHGTSRWTKVSPLYCAGFETTKGEDSIPWYGMKPNGLDPKVHGVSLRCRDDKEQTVHVVDKFNPFTEPYEYGPEKKGEVRNMTLDAAFGSLKVGSGSGHPGILLSEVTHDDRGRTKEHEYKYDNKKEREKQKLPTSRSTYFRFKLKKNINLSPYGVAVVYDNNSEFHFSLVPVEEKKWDLCNRDAWPNKKFTENLRLPDDAWDTYRVDMDEDKLSELAKDVLAPADKEPLSIMITTMTCLPKVASLFSLHDMKLVAKAEPRQLEPGDKHYHVYEAALVLYHLDLGWEVYLAIVSLEEADYVIADLGQSARDTLQDAVSEAVQDFGLAVYELEWGDQRAQDALDAMLVALSQHDISTNEHRTPSRTEPIGLDPIF
jgi:hypothetical protein